MRKMITRGKPKETSDEEDDNSWETATEVTQRRHLMRKMITRRKQLLR